MKERTRIIVASELDLSVRSFSDISDMVGASLGSAGVILTEKDLGPTFFDLRSGLAGELFQKCTNYKLRLAVVLTDAEVYGERFAELAREHHSHNMVRFVRSIDEAKAWLLHSP